MWFAFQGSTCFTGFWENCGFHVRALHNLLDTRFDDCSHGDSVGIPQADSSCDAVLSINQDKHLKQENFCKPNSQSPDPITIWYDYSRVLTSGFGSCHFRLRLAQPGY